MISIAIDIGLTGAVAAVDHAGRADVHDMPVTADGERKRIDGRALILLLRQLIPAGDTAVVLFEDVRARPAGNGGTHGNSMHSQASMMRSRGAIEAVLDVARLPYQVVQPQTWKRHFALLGKDKKASLEVARSLYPANAEKHLARVKDHNRAEAVLMAHYGLRSAA